MRIFPYNDGYENRFGDPMRIERVLDAYCDGSLNKMLDNAKSENPDISSEAMNRLLKAICKAFELRPFNPKVPLGHPEQGTTEQFQMALLQRFVNWRSKKNDSTDLPLNSPMPTVGVQSSGQASSQPMSNQKTFSTVSGSTSR